MSARASASATIDKGRMTAILILYLLQTLSSF